jgi:hypothetical protein
MFVQLNLLTIMRIGIIGSDPLTNHVTNLIKNTKGIDVTGCYDNDYAQTVNFAAHNRITPYSTFEAFLKYIDAIAININTHNSVEIIELCLKYFKHVFLTGAQHLSYKNYQKLEKIAEESNVRFYAVFDFNAELILNDVRNKYKDLVFISLNHNYPKGKGICIDRRISSIVIQDLKLIFSLIKANVKKANANCWCFEQPGEGILSARLDFDNGAATNLVLVNSGNTEERNITLYYKSEILTINFIDNVATITTKGCVQSLPKTVKLDLLQEEALLYEIKLFQSFVQNNSSHLHCFDDQHKCIKISHLIDEKINQFTSPYIFYS